MAMMPGPQLMALFKGLTGMEWPQADEDRLRAIGGLYDTSVEDFRRLATLFEEVVKGVREQFEGEAADAFVESVSRYFSGSGEDGNFLGLAADSAKELGDYARETANNVEYIKWMIIAQLIQLAVEIAVAIALAPFTFGGSLEVLSLAYLLTRQGIIALLKFLLRQLLVHTLINLTVSLVMDQTIQQIQINQGNRKEKDPELTKQAAAFGAIGGVLGGLFSPLGQGLSRGLGKLFGKDFGHFVGKDVGNVLTKTLPKRLPVKGEVLGKEFGQLLEQWSTQLTRGFGKGDGAGGNWLVGLVGKGTGKNADDFVPFFAKDVGNLFAKHLGPTMGKDAARKLGVEYGKAFAENWGRKDLPGVREALANALAPHKKVLGRGGVNALAHDVPDLITKNMRNGLETTLGYKIGTIVAASVLSGTQQVLTEGFYNLIFAPEHTFHIKDGLLTFGSGVAIGALSGAGHHFIAHPLSVKLHNLGSSKMDFPGGDPDSPDWPSVPKSSLEDAELFDRYRDLVGDRPDTATPPDTPFDTSPDVVDRLLADAPPTPRNPLLSPEEARVAQERLDRLNEELVRARADHPSPGPSRTPTTSADDGLAQLPVGLLDGGPSPYPAVPTAAPTHVTPSDVRQHLARLDRDARSVGMPSAERRALSDAVAGSLDRGDPGQAADHLRDYRERIDELGLDDRLAEYRAHVDAGYDRGAPPGVDEVTWLEHAAAVEAAHLAGDTAGVGRLLDVHEEWTGTSPQGPRTVADMSDLLDRPADDTPELLEQLAAGGATRPELDHWQRRFADPADTGAGEAAQRRVERLTGPTDEDLFGRAAELRHDVQRRAGMTEEEVADTDALLAAATTPTESAQALEEHFTTLAEEQRAAGLEAWRNATAEELGISETDYWRLSADLFDADHDPVRTDELLGRIGQLRADQLRRLADEVAPGRATRPRPPGDDTTDRPEPPPRTDDLDALFPPRRTGSGEDTPAPVDHPPATGTSSDDLPPPRPRTESAESDLSNEQPPTRPADQHADHTPADHGTTDHTTPADHTGDRTITDHTTANRTTPADHTITDRTTADDTTADTTDHSATDTTGDNTTTSTATDHTTDHTATDDTDWQPTTRPAPPRLPVTPLGNLDATGRHLPSYIEQGKALGSARPVGVTNAEHIPGAADRLVPGASAAPIWSQVVEEARTNPEAFLGPGKSYPVTTRRPGHNPFAKQVHEFTVRLEPLHPASTTDVLRADPDGTSVRTELTTADPRSADTSHTDTRPGAVGFTGPIGALVGPQFQLNGRLAFATPARKHIQEFGTQTQRTVRSGSDSQEWDLPMRFVITAVDEGEHPVGTPQHVQGDLVLRVPDTLTETPNPVNTTKRPPDGWARTARTLVPEAVVPTRNAERELRARFHPSVTKVGAPGRAVLKEFTGAEHHRATFKSMLHGPVPSDDLTDASGGRLGALTKQATVRGAKLVGGGSDESMKLKLSGKSSTGTETISTSTTGFDVGGGAGYGTNALPVGGSVMGVGGYSARTSDSAPSGGSTSTKLGLEVKGKAGLYEIEADITYRVAGESATTVVPATVHAWLNAEEAAALGLDAPPHTATPRTPKTWHEPPYLSSGHATGTSQVGTFVEADRLVEQIEGALRTQPGLEGFLPALDDPKLKSMGSRELKDVLDNHRRLRTELSRERIDNSRTTLAGPGIPVVLTKSGALTKEYVRVLVRAPFRTGTHSGDAPGMGVRAGAGGSASLVGSSAAQQSFTLGVEGRVGVPKPVNDHTVAPTVTGAVKYTRRWGVRNTGGAALSGASEFEGPPDSQAFTHPSTFDVRITHLERVRHWARKASPFGTPGLPQAQEVARTARPGEHPGPGILEPIDATFTALVPEGAASTTSLDAFRPGPASPPVWLDHPPRAKELLDQPRNPPKWRYPVAFAHTKEVHQAALDVLQRASGGDPALVLEGSRSRQRIDHHFTGEGLLARLGKAASRGDWLDGLTHDRRLADRVGGIATTVELSRPRLVGPLPGSAVHSGGAATYKSASSRTTGGGVDVTGGLSTPARATDHPKATGTPSLAGKLFGKGWSNTRESTQSATSERVLLASDTSRQYLVQYDADVTLVAESRNRNALVDAVAGPDTGVGVAGAVLHLDGGVFVQVDEAQARAMGLLPAPPHVPAPPPKLPAPPPTVARGLPSALGLAAVRDAYSVLDLVPRARTALGELGSRVLPEQLLEDAMANLDRMGELDEEGVAKLVDSLYDGGVPLLLYDTGVFTKDAYQVTIEATNVVPARVVDLRHDGSGAESGLSGSVKDTSSGTRSTSAAIGVGGTGSGLVPMPHPDEQQVGVGAGVGGTTTATKSLTTADSRTTEWSSTTGTVGPTALVKTGARVELVVRRGTQELARVGVGDAGAPRELEFATHAGDLRVKPQPNRWVPGSSTSRPAREAEPARVDQWRQGGVVPKGASHVEAFRGSGEVRAGLERALRDAGAGEDVVTGSATWLSAQAAGSNEMIRAHLNTMLTGKRPGVGLDRMTLLAHRNEHVDLRTYAKLSGPRPSTLTDGVEMDLGNSTSRTAATSVTRTEVTDLSGTAPSVSGGHKKAPGASGGVGGDLNPPVDLEQSESVDLAAGTSTARTAKVGTRTAPVEFDLQLRHVATLTDDKGKVIGTGVVDVDLPGSTTLRLTAQEVGDLLGAPVPADVHQRYDELNTAAEQWHTATTEAEQARYLLDDLLAEEQRALDRADDEQQQVNADHQAWNHEVARHAAADQVARDAAAVTGRERAELANRQADLDRADQRVDSARQQLNRIDQQLVPATAARNIAEQHAARGVQGADAQRRATVSRVATLTNQRATAEQRLTAAENDRTAAQQALTAQQQRVHDAEQQQRDRENEAAQAQARVDTVHQALQDARTRHAAAHAEYTRLQGEVATARADATTKGQAVDVARDEWVTRLETAQDAFDAYLADPQATLTGPPPATPLPRVRPAPPSGDRLPEPPGQVPRQHPGRPHAPAAESGAESESPRPKYNPADDERWRNNPERTAPWYTREDDPVPVEVLHDLVGKIAFPQPKEASTTEEPPVAKPHPWPDRPKITLRYVKGLVRNDVATVLVGDRAVDVVRVPLHLVRHPQVSPQQFERFKADYTAKLDQTVNDQGLRLPSNGHQLYVWADFVDTHEKMYPPELGVGDESITVLPHDHPHGVDQTHWKVPPPEADPAESAELREALHETFHYTGLGDRFPDPGRVLLAPGKSATALPHDDIGIMGMGLRSKEDPRLLPRDVWALDHVIHSQGTIREVRYEDLLSGSAEDNAKAFTPIALELRDVMTSSRIGPPLAGTATGTTTPATRPAPPRLTSAPPTEMQRVPASEVAQHRGSLEEVGPDARPESVGGSSESVDGTSIPSEVTVGSSAGQPKGFFAHTKPIREHTALYTGDPKRDVQLFVNWYPGSANPVSYLAGGVGHAWVGVKLPHHDEVIGFGFWPDGDVGPLSAFAKQPGALLPEPPLGPEGKAVRMRTFHISAKELDRAYEYALSKTDADYRLLDYNCVSFARGFVRAATGRDLDGGVIDRPDSLDRTLNWRDAPDRRLKWTGGSALDRLRTAWALNVWQPTRKDLADTLDRFDPNEVLSLANELGVRNPANLLKLAKRIDHLPKSLPSFAQELGLHDPKDLYRVARDLGVDPARLTDFRDDFALLDRGSDHRDVAEAVRPRLDGAEQRAALLGGPSSWKALPHVFSSLDPRAGDVLEGKVLEGPLENLPVRVKTDQVVSNALFDYGKPHAVVLAPDLVKSMEHWLDAPTGHDRARTLPPGFERLDHTKERFGPRALDGTRAGWAQHSKEPLFVTVHGSYGAFELTLRNGTEIKVSGAHLAKLLHNDPDFRRALGEDTTRPIVLISCDTHHPVRISEGEVEELGLAHYGSAASSLRNGLAGLGHTNPLYVATRDVVFHTYPNERGVPEAYLAVTDGGRWVRLDGTAEPDHAPSPPPSTSDSSPEPDTAPRSDADSEPGTTPDPRPRVVEVPTDKGAVRFRLREPGQSMEDYLKPVTDHARHADDRAARDTELTVFWHERSRDPVKLVLGGEVGHAWVGLKPPGSDEVLGLGFWPVAGKPRVGYFLAPGRVLAEDFESTPKWGEPHGPTQDAGSFGYRINADELSRALDYLEDNRRRSYVLSAYNCVSFVRGLVNAATGVDLHTGPLVDHQGPFGRPASLAWPPTNGREVKEAAWRLGVSPAKVNRLSGQDWFDPNALLDTARQLGVHNPANLVRLAEDIGRVPTDTLDLAREMGLDDPKDLYRTARDRHVDPAALAGHPVSPRPGRSSDGTYPLTADLVRPVRATGSPATNGPTSPLPGHPSDSTHPPLTGTPRPGHTGPTPPGHPSRDTRPSTGGTARPEHTLPARIDLPAHQPPGHPSDNTRPPITGPARPPLTTTAPTHRPPGHPTTGTPRSAQHTDPHPTGRPTPSRPSRASDGTYPLTAEMVRPGRRPDPPPRPANPEPPGTPVPESRASRSRGQTFPRSTSLLGNDPGSHQLDPRDRDVLEGATPLGRPVRVRAGDVPAHFLERGNGAGTDVLSFVSDKEQGSVVTPWAAASHRTADHQVLAMPEKHGTPEKAIKAGALRVERAPWADEPHPPLFVMAHADRKGVRVPLRDGGSVDLDGASFAKLLLATEPFRRIARAQPDRPLVLVACELNRPRSADQGLVEQHGLEHYGTAAASLHNGLLALGGRNPVYSATTPVAAHLLAREDNYVGAVKGGRWTRLGGPSAPSTQEARPQETRPQETRPPEPSPREPRSPWPQTREAPPQDTQPPDTQPREARSREPQPQEAQSQEPQSQEAQPQEPQPQEPWSQEARSPEPRSPGVLAQGADPTPNPRPRRLEEVLPRDQWWRLYLDPNHHAEARRKLPDDPGHLYDTQVSPGFQASMVQAYEEVLNPPDMSVARLDSASYKRMHELVTANLNKRFDWSGTTGSSGLLKQTGFPLRAEEPHPDVLADTVGERPLLVDPKRYFADAANRQGPQSKPVAYLDPTSTRNKVIMTNYTAGEAPALIDTVLDTYYRDTADARTDHERLRAIARVVRASHIIHAFQDGNRRLNVHLLLPRLLLEQGFQPVVLPEMAELFQGGFSLDQIATALHRGQDLDLTSDVVFPERPKREDVPDYESDDETDTDSDADLRSTAERELDDARHAFDRAVEARFTAQVEDPGALARLDVEADNALDRVARAQARVDGEHASPERLVLGHDRTDEILRADAGDHPTPNPDKQREGFPGTRTAAWGDYLKARHEFHSATGAVNRAEARVRGEGSSNAPDQLERARLDLTRAELDLNQARADLRAWGNDPDRVEQALREAFEQSFKERPHGVGGMRENPDPAPRTTDRFTEVLADLDHVIAQQEARRSHPDERRDPTSLSLPGSLLRRMGFGAGPDPSTPGVIEATRGNRTVAVRASDVEHEVFERGRGAATDVLSFIPEREQQLVTDWAEVADGTADRTVLELTDPGTPVVDAWRRGELASHRAPWADEPEPPLYVVIHAGNDTVDLHLDNGRTVQTGGAHLAKLLHANPVFRALMAEHPERPLVLLACESNRPDPAVRDFVERNGLHHYGTTASSLHNGLLAHGYRNPLYAATTVVTILASGDGTENAVITRPGNRWTRSGVPVPAVGSPTGGAPPRAALSLAEQVELALGGGSSAS
ncbi:hypothetical protein ACIGNX_01530 [Actinosynnema sp. NPDC053489]|uniref:WXG100-like domain-containing protein n=1 Tax=Actinosynnema sp. NPDC053489 TaxID=3363916 RepID=UPI0037CBA024